MRLLLTGATSFVGQWFLGCVLNQPGWEIYSIERPSLRYRRPSSRVKTFYHDIRSEFPESIVHQVQDADCIVHLAADVSGIKSLSDPGLSVSTNVIGTFNVLEMARKLKKLGSFIYVSTGEAVGAASFPEILGEDAPLRPSNPYAASKATAEALSYAYRVSFEVPTIVVRPMNLFGPWQAVTRFVPMVMKNLLSNQPIKCHVDKNGRAGSRNWLHAKRFSSVLIHLVEHGHPGEIYHTVGPERSNEEVIETLSRAVGRSPRVEKIVPGASHDFRYALKDTKTGLQLLLNEGLDEDLAATARWYADNLEFFQ